MTLRQTIRLVPRIAPVVIGVVIAVALRNHPTADRIAIVATGTYVVVVLLARMRRSAARPTSPGAGRTGASPSTRWPSSCASSGRSSSRAPRGWNTSTACSRTCATSRPSGCGLRRGISLEWRPEAARAVLGERAWDMVMRRDASSDRKAPAPTLAEIRALLRDAGAGVT